MDRFTTMNTFVEVVKQGSLSQAAKTLGISRALVSRHLADLEEQLGIRLLARTTRSLHLTEAGRRHAAFSERLLRSMQDEESSIVSQNQAEAGSLNVIAPKWIGSLDAGDAITDFAVAYPRIKVELTLGGLTARTYDFLADGFDVALQTKTIANSAVVVRKIATLRYLVCAAPAYLSREAAPLSPHDLGRHHCLVHINDPMWRFSDGRRTRSLKVESNFLSNSFLVLREAALKGLGVAVLPRRIVRDDIAASALVELLDTHPVPDRPLYAAFAPGGRTPKRVRYFVDFLAKWFDTHPL